MAAPMEVPVIYLHIYDKENDVLTCPVYTALVLFATHYTEQYLGVRFILVRSPILPSCPVPQGKVTMPVGALDGLKYECCHIDEVSVSVCRCTFPVAVTLGGSMLHSGLCSVLRLMLKTGDKQLLGFRESCLRSCAEVSVWTKTCEIEFPSVMATSLEATGKNSAKQDVASEILKLENRLRQPPVIHNIGKMKKQILHKHMAALDMTVSKRNTTKLAQQMRNMKVTNDTNQLKEEDLNLLTANGKLTSTTTKLTGLQHIYAEGPDFTLTDLILFPCVAAYLNSCDLGIVKKKCSHLLEWFQRVSTKERIMKAASICDIHIAVVESSDPLDEEETCLPPVHNTRTDTKVKVKVKQKELEELSQLLTSVSIHPSPCDHPCLGSLGLPWQNMPAAVHPEQGDLPPSRIQRKCHQLESLAMAVKHIARDGDVIVDFCSGGGHLGLLIAYLLPECQVLLVENKEESIMRAVDRMEEMKLNNVTLYQSNVDYFCGAFDVGVCLHACGVATDLVLQRCLDTEANFVICPCCYGAIQNTHTMSYPRSKAYKQADISYQTYVKLVHSADQAKQGKTFMNYVDHDRALVAEEHGYSVTLCSLDPLECSPKNNLLIGQKNLVGS